MEDYVEAPKNYVGTKPSIFLAGGITGCPNWQKKARRQIEGSGVVVLNPRRKNFPIDDSTAAYEQIKWEYRHLQIATSILFWFCAEAIQPIALFELGSWLRSGDRITIGAHPDYERRDDVVIQTSLARPDLRVYDTLWTTVNAAVQPLAERIEDNRKRENTYAFYDQHLSSLHAKDPYAKLLNYFKG